MPPQSAGIVSPRRLPRFSTALYIINIKISIVAERHQYVIKTAMNELGIVPPDLDRAFKGYVTERGLILIDDHFSVDNSPVLQILTVVTSLANQCELVSVFRQVLLVDAGEISAIAGEV
jgi:hypothetical protein